MKFLVFADLHHFPGIFKGGTWDDLICFQKRAEQKNVDFIIHAGDFCHGAEQVMEYVDKYNSFHIPSYHVLGNHDTEYTSYEGTLKMYNMQNNYYYFDKEGYRIIACDPNYYLEDGKYIHYSEKGYFDKDCDYIPPEQLVWLERTIAESPFPCVIISHQSFEREVDGVKNLMEVRNIIRLANQRKPHSVILCINGHYHRDCIRIIDNVCYLDLNSASFDWVDNAHEQYPRQLCEQYKLIDNTLVYNDPLHAIVTLEGTKIVIEGMKSDMFMGINREDTLNDIYDGMGRPVIPEIQSVSIILE